MTSLLLLRHGQIRANREGRWHGSTNSPLTWRGRRQAKRTARHVAATHQPLTAIYSSPLDRCRHTADAVAELTSHEPIVLEELREYAIGDWENMRFKDLAEAHDFVGRATSNPAFEPPGGESLAAVADRLSSAIDGIAAAHDPEERVLVVSHGAALAVAVGVLLHNDPARWVDYHFSNCSLTELVLSPAPYVNFFNSTQHL